MKQSFVISTGSDSPTGLLYNKHFDPSFSQYSRDLHPSMIQQSSLQSMNVRMIGCKSFGILMRSFLSLTAFFVVWYGQVSKRLIQSYLAQI